MSRIQKSDRANGKALAYGKDHACGWFVQVWTIPPKPHATDDIPDDSNMLVDKDTVFDGIGVHQLAMSSSVS